MYTSNQHSKLIQRLKLQPRHSRVTTISDALGALNTSAKVLGSSVVSATDSINKLNDQTRKASGYQYLSSILDNLGTKYQTVVKEALDFEKRNKSLQDSFGLTAESAAKLGASLDKVAHQYAISEDNIRKYAGAIKNLLPTLRQSASSDKSFYQGMIKTQKILQTNLGLTEDQANKYTLYAQIVLNCTINFRIKKSAVYNGPVPLTARRKNESQRSSRKTLCCRIFGIPEIV